MLPFDDDDPQPQQRARWRPVALYTKARRLELMIGRIQDMQMPTAHWWQWAAAILSVVGLWFFRGWWLWLPLPQRLTFMVASPVMAWWVSGKFATNPFATVAAYARHFGGRYGPTHQRRRRITVIVPLVEDEPRP